MITRELITSDHPLTDVRGALQRWFGVRSDAESYVRRSYYDTFDGLLYDAGLTLSAQGGIRTVSRRDGAPLETGQRAEDAAGVRALLPIAEIELTAQVLHVLDERQKTVCRIVIERALGLRPRALMVPLRGYETGLGQVWDLLLASEHFVPADVPLVDEAVCAAGGDPAGTKVKLDVQLVPGMRAEEAAVRALTRLNEILEVNLPGALADIDTEFLHDYRVAVRRTRTVMRELRGVFCPRRSRSCEWSSNGSRK